MQSILTSPPAPSPEYWGGGSPSPVLWGRLGWGLGAAFEFLSTPAQAPPLKRGIKFFAIKNILL